MGKSTERTNAHQDVTAETLTASRLIAMRYAPKGRGVTLETLTDGQMSGKSGRKTENGHISTATAEGTPGPRWKGPAEQSLRLAAVDFDAVGVPVEMIRVGFVERLEERIVGALVGNHGVVAMAREDGHITGNAHELIHQ